MARADSLLASDPYVLSPVFLMAVARLERGEWEAAEWNLRFLRHYLPRDPTILALSSWAALGPVAGDLQVEVRFGMSMKPMSYSADIQVMGIDGPIGEPIALQPDASAGTAGWSSANDTATERRSAVYTLVNSVTVPAGVPARLVVRLLDPRDANDNPLNSVATIVYLGAL